MVHSSRFTHRLLAGAAAAGSTFLLAAGAHAVEPLTIGFDIELTGGLAPNGRAALLAMQIWAENVNATGGLLGRTVKLVYYDDQSNPALVPAIITKLLDVDHVDILIGGNGTTVLAPAMPVVMQRNLTLLGLFGLDINSEFHYKNYFSIIPTGGPNPKEAFSQGFFEVAAALTPRATTVALVGGDTEFGRNALDGARALAQRAGYKIVYDGTYPPGTADYTPIVRAIQATDPELVFVASYPPDTVGIVRAATEVGLRARLFGGNMVGLQATAIKMQLGPLLNGIVVYDFWLPWVAFANREALDFLKQYQARAAASGVDALGYYLPPFAYADMQVLQQAVEGTMGVDQTSLADFLRSHTFHTVVGDIRFGPNGEWTEARVLEVQFQGVKGHDRDQFADPAVEVILWPPQYRTGILNYPYTDAKQ